MSTRVERPDIRLTGDQGRIGDRRSLIAESVNKRVHELRGGMTGLRHFSLCLSDLYVEEATQRGRLCIPREWPCHSGHSALPCNHYNAGTNEERMMNEQTCVKSMEAVYNGDFIRI